MVYSTLDVSVRDVMRTVVETVPVSASARTVARRLFEADVGSVVVVHDDQSVGIVTDSDLLALVAGNRRLDGVEANACMTAPLVTVDVDDRIETAAETLRRHDIDQAPVLDAGELVGVVSVRELASYLPQLTYRGGDSEYHYEDRAAPGVDVGDVVRFSKRLSDRDVRAFAAASGDQNRLHLDDDYAARTRFGERIAHGILGVGVVSAALAKLPGLVVYLSQSVRFVAPVSVDERVTAECEVVEAKGRGRYRLRTQVLGEDGEPVIDGEAVVLIDDAPTDDDQQRVASADVDAGS